LSIAVGAVLVGIWPYQVIMGLSATGCAAAALLMVGLSGSSSLATRSAHLLGSDSPDRR
jgi:hypothetical protein